LDQFRSFEKSLAPRPATTFDAASVDQRWPQFAEDHRDYTFSSAWQSKNLPSSSQHRLPHPAYHIPRAPKSHSNVIQECLPWCSEKAPNCRPLNRPRPWGTSTWGRASPSKASHSFSPGVLHIDSYQNVATRKLPRSSPSTAANFGRSGFLATITLRSTLSADLKRPTR
jgi:hypothetical protein